MINAHGTADRASGDGPEDRTLRDLRSRLLADYPTLAPENILTAVVEAQGAILLFGAGEEAWEAVEVATRARLTGFRDGLEKGPPLAER